MRASTSYSSLRANLKGVLDQVCTEHAPIIITRKTGEDVVIVSRQDFDSLEETAYLLRSPKNAQRLLSAIKRTGSGKIKFKSIDDVKNEINF